MDLQVYLWWRLAGAKQKIKIYDNRSMFLVTVMVNYRSKFESNMFLTEFNKSRIRQSTSLLFNRYAADNDIHTPSFGSPLGEGAVILVPPTWILNP